MTILVGGADSLATKIKSGEIMTFGRLVGAIAVVVTLSVSAHAVPVVPGYDVFGPLPAATFGGSGIPNHAVAISTAAGFGSDVITLGLTAHQRFVGPNLANNGAGDFFATAGTSTPGAATWNFAYYLDIVGGGAFDDYRFELSYDLDGATGNDISTHGTINFNDTIAFFGGAPALAATTNVQDSQNLGFTFLTTGFPGVTPPVPPVVFNPNVSGEYTFELRVYDALVGGTLLDAASIRVNVAAVPEAGAALLFGAIVGLGGCVTLGRRYLGRRS
jgi:hypothetical protein